ncbi:MAG TPA: 16S rRNA (guanine(966)-N(2))-methyltransferase RsmD [Nannocystaceae bacterium]|nr:16S rRNA (guanine(966)-N(2))-methyltransferase RsmD [Nannocystaceae bacterium]
MQRISAGALRGRKLMALPAGVAGLRPTGARVREAIFDRLGPGILDTRVLDLYAGSGALAIEALSRGSTSALLVEDDARVVKHLQGQLAALGLGARAKVVRSTAERVLAGGPGPATYDLVFVDPPFATPHVFGPITAALVRHRWLAAGARIVCERERVRGTAPSVEYPAELELEASRIYGQVVVEFLQLA